MGMDVYGKNPKQNKKLSDFPVYNKFQSMEFNKKWKELEKDEKTKEKYWKEMDDYEDVNPGQYFRNNVWWWRPLWNYCYAVADDIIEGNLQIKEYETNDDGETDDENYRWVKAKYDDGHGNSGAGLNDKYAKLLGNRLMECIADGSTIKYQAEYIQWQDDLPDDDCMRCSNNNRGNNKKKECTNCNKTGKTKSFDSHYPFDVDNVERFARFCLESGGFEIC